MILALRVAGGAFLIAVLTCDLTFDLPVWRARGRDSIGRDRALDAMTEYYRRITARGSLLSISVTVVMLGILASLCHELVTAPRTGLARFAIEGSLAAGPILLAGIRTFPCARRLAAGEGDAATRTEAARSIARDHALALPAMLAFVLTELARL